jgi:hypothetical protein
MGGFSRFVKFQIRDSGFGLGAVKKKLQHISRNFLNDLRFYFKFFIREKD